MNSFTQTKSLSRRQLTKFGVSIGGGISFLNSSAPLLHAATPSNAADPHFFLAIHVSGGMDCSYLFDPRPLSFTQHGKIQNHRNEEPKWITGKEGTGTWATSLTDPLMAYKDYFSVANGVVMSASDDGHLQNFSYLITGNSLLNGESFIPVLNQSLSPSQRTALDMISPSNDNSDLSFLSLTNGASSVGISPDSLEKIKAAAAESGMGHQPNSYDNHLLSRFRNNSRAGGSFGKGNQNLASGFTKSYPIFSKLSQIDVSNQPSDIETKMAFVNQAFRFGLSKSAFLTLSNDFDTHDPTSARQQPTEFQGTVSTLVSILNSLKDTAYDNNTSMLDHTTFMVFSEFSRTLRQTGKPMETTGTDHNALNNSIILGGKCIKSGIYIGASDLDTLDAAGEFSNVSGAHRQLDRELLKTMGKPFDFSTQTNTNRLPESYQASDYLSASSVVNTIFSAFDVSEHYWRKIGPRSNQAVAPIASKLLA